ncbi:hypothetical protein FA95DRAFT_1487329 [Auriscalpium vulgare]|uniref:Uncharacterized protein n=1 Tax=Auriscalpium vulgare TaxID=40419 RepID=A0ACB8S2T9_9AGAM|nr:hypothetical protein FA95DRAFT_1487329 [Auriscalpium vulgare]
MRCSILNAFTGCALRFLPTYSPDLNPIEESFSAVKSWLARNGDRLARDEFAEQAIEEACAAVITAEKAAGWFAHSGY